MKQRRLTQNLAQLRWAFLPWFVGTFFTSAGQADLPTIEVQTSRQLHFAMSNPSLTQGTFHEICQSWSQSDQAMAIALVEGDHNNNLPWPGPEMNGSALTSYCLLRAGRTWWPQTGEDVQMQRVVLPAAVIPATWDSIGITEVLLGVNGVVQTILPDVPAFVPNLPDGVTLTTLSLSIHLENGETKSGELVLNVRSTCPQPAPDLPPWPQESMDNPWWVGTFHNGIAVTGSALVKLGSDGVFDAPVVLCDGFDPGLQPHAVAFGHGDQNWETLWDCDNSYRTTLDSLLTMGKDLVFVDFADGTRDVRENAGLLQHVLALCNEYKTSTRPLALIGMSMGGVIGRLALREMETLGIPHCTSLFVAFDSPMRGAYLPWSMLQAVSFFSNLSAEAEALQMALESTAAEQLLFLTPSGTPAEHALLQSEMLAEGLPEWPTCGTMLNSHPDAPFPLLPGPLLQASESIFGWEYANVQLNAMPGDPYHDASSATAFVTFDAQLPNAQWGFGDPMIYESIGHCPASAPVVESWSGSRTSHLDAFQSALVAGGIDVAQCQSETMFIPSRSALDVDWTASPEESPFDWVHTETMAIGATQHCDLSHHGATLLEWIDQATALDHDIFGRNWPLRTQIVASTNHISHLVIGAEGSTLAASMNAPFSVTLSPCLNDLNVDSVLTVGDPEGSFPGELIIRQGQKLTLAPQANATVGLGSAVRIEAGGTLVLSEHAFGSFAGQLDLQAGATLVLHDHAQLSLVGDASQWRCNGHVDVAGNVSCQFDGEGQVWIENAAFALNPASEFQWQTGIPGEALGSISLEEAGTLSTSGTGKMSFETCRLEMAEASTFVADGPRIVFTHSEVFGPDPEPWFAMPLLHCSGRIRLQGCEVRNIALTNDASGPHAFASLNTDFHHVDVSGATGGAQISTCNWQDAHLQWMHAEHPIAFSQNLWAGGHDDGRPLLRMQNCPSVRLADNEWTEHREGIDLENCTVHLKCNRLERLETAVILRSHAHSVWTGSNGGGNRLENNDVHFRLIEAPLPELAEGANAFLPPSMARFAGTAWAQMGPGNTAAPINASGNAWNAIEVGTSPFYEPSGITACNPGWANAEIPIADPAPLGTESCDEHGGTPTTPVDGTVKHTEPSDCPTGKWVPNPASDLTGFELDHGVAEDVQVQLFSLTGAKQSLSIQKGNQIPLTSLSQGTYTSQIQFVFNNNRCQTQLPLVHLSTP